MKHITMGMVGFLAIAATGCTTAAQQKEALYQSEIDRLSAEKSILKQNFDEEKIRRERLEALALRSPRQDTPVIQQLTANPSDKPSASTKSAAKKTAPVVSDKPMSEKEMQAALKKAGCYHGKVDGKAGPATKTALKTFQKQNGLKADGVAGKQTVVKLREIGL